MYMLSQLTPDLPIDPSEVSQARIRLKTRVGADFINTQNNDTWVTESWRSLFRRGFF